jgi:GNAT superfamily N-acetyltransferase
MRNNQAQVADRETTKLEFRPCPADADPAAKLLQAMRDEMAEVYEGLDIDNASMPAAGPAELGPPGGVFIVGYEDENAVCCGGIKRLPDGSCEIKRMFVVPEARGRELGYTHARLDTGPRQPRARRMYVAAGYREIENFNANPVATYFGEKVL